MTDREKKEERLRYFERYPFNSLSSDEKSRFEDYEKEQAAKEKKAAQTTTKKTKG